jgi:hypothetical protein
MVLKNFSVFFPHKYASGEQSKKVILVYKRIELYLQRKNCEPLSRA